MKRFDPHDPLHPYDEPDARFEPVALLAFAAGVVFMLLIIVLATRDMWGMW